MERLTEGFGGWVRWQGTDFPHPVFIRLTEESGRLVVAELYISGDGARLDARTFRRLPLGRIETWVNQPDVATTIRYKMSFPAPDLAMAASLFASSPRKVDDRHPSDWANDMLWSQVKGSGVRRARPGRTAEPLPEPVEEVIDLRVEVPDTFRYDDAFYARVAEVYELAGRYYAAPAREIADENGVPLATVQRWVKEARKRKILGPGRPRKET